MSYPVTVLEGGKIQIGGWVYTVKELKTSWKLTYDMDNMEVVVSVPKSTAAPVEEHQTKLEKIFLFFCTQKKFPKPKKAARANLLRGRFFYPYCAKNCPLRCKIKLKGV